MAKITDDIDIIEVIKDIAVLKSWREEDKKEINQFKVDLENLRKSREANSKYIITTVIAVLALLLAAVGQVREFVKLLPKQP